MTTHMLLVELVDANKCVGCPLYYEGTLTDSWWCQVHEEQILDDKRPSTCPLQTVKSVKEVEGGDIRMPKKYSRTAQARLMREGMCNLYAGKPSNYSTHVVYSSQWGVSDDKRIKVR
jgi:hypothetical protein